MKYILVLLFAPSVAMACNSSLFVAELFIDIGDYDTPQEDVLLTGPEAQSALCQKNTQYDKMVHAAQKRLNAQYQLLKQWTDEGKLRPNEVRYYNSYYDDIHDNIISCEQQIKSYNQNDFPSYKERMVFYSKPNGVSEIHLKDEDGTFLKKFISHVIWLDKLMAHEGVHLCETRFVNVSEIN